MVTRDTSLAVWSFSVLLFVLAEAVSRIGNGRAGARRFLRRLAAPVVSEVLLFVGWMWLGWHLFAR